MKNFRYKKSIIVLSWVGVVLWLVFIYSLSAQPATESSNLSKKITEVVIETVDKITPIELEARSVAELVDRFNGFVRKNAHFFIYLVLGILTMGALRRSGVHRRKAFLLAMGICVLYAVSDEVHQYFVPGRSAQVMDVVIDSVGAATGIVCYRK